MVQKLSKSFTAVGSSEWFYIAKGQSLDYSISGTFSGTAKLEFTQSNGANVSEITSKTAAASGRIEDSPGGQYRFRCSAYTSGTIVTSISSANPISPAAQAQEIIIPAAAQAKVGGTAGWVVAAADNLALVTCPASQTGSKLVIPIPGLKVGDVIQNFSLIGQVESAGNNVVIDADLRVLTAAAADVVDASAGSMTQLTVSADAILGGSNTETVITDRKVAADETYYLLVTATTGALTDIALQGVKLKVLPAPTN